ncbi:hypothetical protein RvY_18665 [Ramazzottius varieornatus]|uniref:Metalloendopeptidase n=1 Tax=Ramazzottius varieornatus TaxID=947166 RepID=A0A1D1W6L9_RAMVA|nr:hypothetical protein RvY_18665 [Ramazzottius varieornatus]
MGSRLHLLGSAGVVLLSGIWTGLLLPTWAGPVNIPLAWQIVPKDSPHRISEPNQGSNAAVQTHMFEGDIAGIDLNIGDRAQAAFALQNAIVDKNLRWKNGMVPYKISESFTTEQKRIIQDALRDIMAKTCIVFVPRRSEADYISFVNRGLGCSSYVARVGGEQLIDLMVGCLSMLGEIQHEVMHALGFFHEQSRTDRDKYVTIVWANLIPGTEDQFRTYRTDNLDMPYDYDSIMHYGWNYFAADRTRATIVPKTARSAELGTRKIISDWDVEKINRLYECSSKRRNSNPEPPRPSTTDRLPSRDRTVTGPKPWWNLG